MGGVVSKSASRSGFKKLPLSGIGINDVEYPTIVKVGGRFVTCPFYRRWSCMFQRCYSTKYQITRPSYIGCSVDPEWHLFSNFRKWMMSQDYEGKQLDKDLLVEGNKVYSPSTCVFVDSYTNSFLSDSAATRSKYGMGVEKVGSKYVARCRHKGRVMNLGRYNTVAEANQAYYKYKLELAYILANQQKDDRVAIAILSRFIS